MGLDPSAPEMTLLLVMLHTGTMLAVILFFWRRWRDIYFRSAAALKRFSGLAILATAVTGLVGISLMKLIAGKSEVESLFRHLELIAPALAAAGILILTAGILERRFTEKVELTAWHAALLGAVQGLCLPFRGFSRSASTISVGMLARVGKEQAENFSFALAVLLTPAVIGRETLRLLHARANLAPALAYSAVGAIFAFGAGLLALRWLSGWLESGRWYLFGIYCLTASAVVAGLHLAGY